MTCFLSDVWKFDREEHGLQCDKTPMFSPSKKSELVDFVQLNNQGNPVLCMAVVHCHLPCNESHQSYWHKGST